MRPYRPKKVLMLLVNPRLPPVQKNAGPPMGGPIIINGMSNLRESVKARLKEEKISFLLVQFVDLSGAAKVKMCPVEALDALVDEGAGFAGAAIGGFAQGPNSPD